jgi:hypothetical protein
MPTHLGPNFACCSDSAYLNGWEGRYRGAELGARAQTLGCDRRAMRQKNGSIVLFVSTSSPWSLSRAMINVPVCEQYFLKVVGNSCSLMARVKHE